MVRAIVADDIPTTAPMSTRSILPADLEANCLRAWSSVGRSTAWKRHRKTQRIGEACENCGPFVGSGGTDLERQGFGCSEPQRESEMPATAPKKLDDLFHETLKDIYYAERRILKALPKMAKGARSPDLKTAFEKHRDETEEHVERLQQVFDILGKRAQGKTCQAIEGILEEGEEVLDEFKGSPALDAGLVSSAQAVEHYEITRYGTLKRWAEELGMKDAAKLLDQTLREEAKTDEALTSIADSVANQKAKAA
jgi:ferritin-like metal-binding protein YciE